jgi:hypothetical protein
MAERRQGGQGVVIECKHYTTMNVARRHIDRLIEYKRASHASLAVLFVSDTTIANNCLSDGIVRYADELEVGVFPIRSESQGSIRDWLVDRRTKKELSRSIDRPWH